MSKLSYFFVTFIGAVPAGGCLFLLIQNFLNRADVLAKSNTFLLGVAIMASVCATLVVLTPFIVLVFYKDNRQILATAGAGAAAPGADSGKGEKKSADGGFDDVIPDDYDEDELAATVEDDADDYGDLDVDDEYDDFDDDDFEMDEYDDE